jgi:hypothetical protein
MNILIEAYIYIIASFTKRLTMETGKEKNSQRREPVKRRSIVGGIPVSIDRGVNQLVQPMWITWL